MIYMVTEKAPTWARLWWFVERRVNGVRRGRYSRAIRRLVEERAFSETVVPGTIVSLTTHGSRVSTVHHTIESILVGTVRPERVVLWLDSSDAYRRLVEDLGYLRSLGLEVRLTNNFGPHTKYWPMVCELGTSRSNVLVTADDDVLYPRRWLEDLTQCWSGESDTICAFRCHKIRFSSPYHFAPYSTWVPAFSKESLGRLFFTGVSGVLYPSTMLQALLARGEIFLESAPKADDVWLNSVALQEGMKVRQVGRVPRHFPLIPDTQTMSLVSSNVGSQGNDRQIDATFTQDEVHRIFLMPQSKNLRVSA